MSISINLVLLLLFLSLTSCNSRILGVGVAPDHPAANEFHHSITKANDEKLNHFTNEAEMQNPLEKEEKRVKDEEADDQTDSASEKMWRVPHRKREGEEAAGFNLDYLPPKTHPPSHN